MTKVKVIREFIDVKTDEMYSVGDVVEFPAARLKQIKEAASIYGSDFVEEIKKGTSTKSKGKVDDVTED